jgi:hypothetical protein
LLCPNQPQPFCQVSQFNPICPFCQVSQFNLICNRLFIHILVQAVRSMVTLNTYLHKWVPERLWITKCSPPLMIQGLLLI